MEQQIKILDAQLKPKLRTRIKKLRMIVEKLQPVLSRIFLREKVLKAWNISGLESSDTDDHISLPQMLKKPRGLSSYTLKQINDIKAWFDATNTIEAR